MFSIHSIQSRRLRSSRIVSWACISFQTLPTLECLTNVLVRVFIYRKMPPLLKIKYFFVFHQMYEFAHTICEICHPILIFGTILLLRLCNLPPYTLIWHYTFIRHSRVESKMHFGHSSPTDLLGNTFSRHRTTVFSPSSIA